jgi:quinol monooxygenase YgiN
VVRRAKAGDVFFSEAVTHSPTNIGYDLYRSAEDPDRFMRFEVWRNDAALERHKAMPYLRASFERRKDAGWRTEITRWYPADEEVGKGQAALG